MTADDDRNAAAPREQASFVQLVLAVFWSFFGVRKRRHLERDAASIKPQHAIVAGVVGMVVFVLALLLVVRMILSRA
jgi:hypothetical protein